MLARLLPFILAAVGVAKAGALVFLGSAFGLPAILVSIAAALWVTGPATVAWLVADRRRRKALTSLAPVQAPA